MKCDFSRTNSPENNYTLKLKAVYHLSADETYDVFRTDTGRSGFIALRTIHGSGQVYLKGMEPLGVYSETLLLFRHNHINRYFCSDDQWIFWWLEFEGEFEGEFDGEFLLPMNKVLRIDLIQREINDCNTCLEMLRIGNRASNTMASATLVTLLCKWVMQFQNTSNEHIHYREEVQKLILEMKTNLQKPINIKEMANRIGLCERRFRQVFKFITGYQPKKYFEGIRNEMAEEYLKNTPFSILEISEHLGYSSQFHFSKAFSMVHGVSPFAFRKSSRES